LNLIYIGSLTPRKQVDVLLQAFARVLERRPNARLTIVGGGPQDGRLRQLAASLGIAGAVTFTGLLAEYPFQLLAASDIFVSASEAESFGLVFVEAMCMGLPVVACTVGGIPEVVAHGETGVLVPSGDPEAFAAAIESLAADSELRVRMGQAGVLRARRCFDLPDKIDSLVTFFDGFRAGRSCGESCCAGGNIAG
jgi:glycosyltransferase involved in cell wall biosynthesis